MNLMEGQQAPQSAEGEAKVITLCGSTKFEAEFAEVNQRLTMEGCVVISLGMFSLPDLPDYDWTVDSSDLKGRLGGVHFQKIRMADEVYIVDPGGYLGESTRREIAYAESLGKPVRYLSRERLARTGDGRESNRAVRKRRPMPNTVPESIGRAVTTSPDLLKHFVGGRCQIWHPRRGRGQPSPSRRWRSTARCRGAS